MSKFNKQRSIPGGTHLECSYKTICEYYSPDCVELTCWRARYVNGMFSEKFKKLLKDGSLEELLNKNHIN